MAIAKTQSTFTQNIAATSGSKSFGSTPALNSIIVVTLAWEGAGSDSSTVTCSDNQASGGNTYTKVKAAQVAGTNPNACAVFTATAAKSSGTFTVSFSNATGSAALDITISEWSGVNAGITDGTAVSYSNTAPPAPPINMPGITTTVVGDVLIMVAAAGDSGGAAALGRFPTTATTNSQLDLNNFSGALGSAADFTAATTGTGSQVDIMEMNGNGNSLCAVAFALKAAASGTLPTGQQWDRSSPPPKTPVQVDAYPNMLARGMNPQPQVLKRLEAAEQRKFAIQVDAYPNVLVRGYNPQPQVKRLDATEQRKFAVQVDAYPNVLVRGYNPQPGVQTLWAAEQRKFAVQVDAYPNVLVRGYNPQPTVQGWFASAPARAANSLVDAIPNLLMTTLAVVAAATLPPGKQAQASAPQPKYDVRADQPLQTPLTLGINPQPTVQTLWAVEQRKFAVQVDAYPNTLALGYNPQPQIQRLDASAPIVKYAIQVDAYPNLNVLSAPQIPPGLQWSVSAPITKYAVGLDQPLLSPLTLGMNPQPTIQRLDAYWPAIVAKASVYADQPLQSPLTLGTSPQGGLQSFVGMFYYEAAKLILDLGYNVDVPLQTYNASLPAQLVVGQFPAQGTVVQQTQKIVLIVNMPTYLLTLTHSPYMRW